MNLNKVNVAIVLALLMTAASIAVGSDPGGSANYVYALNDSQYAELTRRGDLSGVPDGTKNIGNSVAYADKYNANNEIPKNRQIDEGSFYDGSCINSGNCDNGYYCDKNFCQPCDYPCWTVSADYIVLGRVGTSNQTLIESWLMTVGPTIESELLNSNDLDQGFHGGPRLGLIRHGSGRFDLELLYFQIDGWNSYGRFYSHNTASPVTNQFLYFTAPGNIQFTNLAVSDWPMQFDYSSKVYNSELNLRWKTSDRVTMLAGFRWMELREKLHGEVFAPVFNSTWHTDARNDLYGFQLGWEAILCRLGRFSIEGLTKGGIYGNHTEQISSVNSYWNNGTGAASTTRAAFIGEVGLQCKFQLNDKLALRAGYEALWLQGMALAPGQIHETNFQTNQFGIDTSGSVLYHGATAGLEYNF
jgi:hypothetical protein